MAFVAARCPQCGGELQLDSGKEMGFCMHCGSKIVIQDAIRKVQIDSSNMIEPWMKMGYSASEAGNHLEAYGYFTKVVENDPENWLAMFLKGKAAGWQSTYGKPRFSEFAYGIGAAQKIIIDKNIPDDEKKEAWISFAAETFELASAYYNLVADIHLKNLNPYSNEVYKDIHEGYIKCISLMEVGLKLVDSIDDEKARSQKLALMKSIYYLCQNVCTYHMYHSSGSSYYWGYYLNEKQRFIAQYDEMCTEIRKIEPGFKKGDFIDRLEPPFMPTDLLGDARDLANKKLQEIADKEIINKEVENQQQKYWMEHPEEYKEFVRVEADRKERISKLQEEVKSKIDNINNMIKSNFSEKTNLMSERSKLGVFDVKKKKVIDEQTKVLQDRHMELYNSRDELDKYLNQEIRKIMNS